MNYSPSPKYQKSSSVDYNKLLNNIFKSSYLPDYSADAQLRMNYMYPSPSYQNMSSPSKLLDIYPEHKSVGDFNATPLYEPKHSDLNYHFSDLNHNKYDRGREITNCKINSYNICHTKSIPDHLYGKVTEKSKHFRPMITEADLNTKINENDELISVGEEELLGIDRKIKQVPDIHTQEKFLRVRNDHKFACLGESSKLNSCARSQSHTNLYFNQRGNYNNKDNVEEKRDNYNFNIKSSNKNKIIKSFNEIYDKMGVHSPYKFPDTIKNFYEHVVTENVNDKADNNYDLSVKINSKLKNDKSVWNIELKNYNSNSYDSKDTKNSNYEDLPSKYKFVSLEDLIVDSKLKNDKIKMNDKKYTKIKDDKESKDLTNLTEDDSNKIVHNEISPKKVIYSNYKMTNNNNLKKNINYDKKMSEYLEFETYSKITNKYDWAFNEEPPKKFKRAVEISYKAPLGQSNLKQLTRYNPDTEEFEPYFIN